MDLMRKSGSWMTIWDDRILEYIREHEGSSVGELEDSDYVRVSNAHISRRCKKMAEHGLLRPLGNGVYVITERGESYLDGELDTHDDAPEDELTRGGSRTPSSSSTENGV
mgnify:CR=1 FL=1